MRLAGTLVTRLLAAVVVATGAAAAAAGWRGAAGPDVPSTWWAHERATRLAAARTAGASAAALDPVAGVVVGNGLRNVEVAEVYPVAWNAEWLDPTSLVRAEVQVEEAEVVPEAVIKPEYPWERYLVFAYNSVVRNGTRTSDPLLMYYDCIEPGDGLKLGPRRVCLATSTDGGWSWVKPLLWDLPWTDPATGARQPSNIVWPTQDLWNSSFAGEASGAFFDTNPACPPGERIKQYVVSDMRLPPNMTCLNGTASPPRGMRLYVSGDGVHFSIKGKLGECSPIVITGMRDTNNVGWYAPELGEYVLWIRSRETVSKDEQVRTVGVCHSRDPAHFNDTTQCKMSVYSIARDDPLAAARTDVYTPSAMPYRLGRTILMPSIYWHFGDNPYNKSNDGLVQPRLVVTHDAAGRGGVAPVALARNGNTTFVPFGINTCDFVGSLAMAGGWCPLGPDRDGQLSRTQLGTSVRYMAAGWAPSNDGLYAHFFVAGLAMTHATDAVTWSWGNNSGIQLLRWRRDGFAAVHGHYNPGASFRSLPLPVPKRCAAAGQATLLLLNIRTSLLGSVTVSLLEPASLKPLPGFGAANPLKGSFVDHPADWSYGRRDLSSIAGATVVVQFDCPDSAVYSWSFACQDVS